MCTEKYKENSTEADFMKKVIIYLGLFDKNSKCQEISTLDAYKIASNLLIDIVGFGTISEANGVYTHNNGEIVDEPTLRIEVSDADVETMKRLAIALKQTFNQESVGFEVVQTNFNFVWTTYKHYGGWCYEKY